MLVKLKDDVTVELFNELTFEHDEGDFYFNEFKKNELFSYNLNVISGRHNFGYYKEDFDTLFEIVKE